jgi:hypothetical protein
MLQNFCGDTSWKMTTWKTRKEEEEEEDSFKMNLRKVGCENRLALVITVLNLKVQLPES